jgi:ketosteroid isomerase-like protein
MLSPRRLALAVLAAAAACTPPRIPGTEIPDNPDTRQIIAVIEAYSAALQKKDAQAILTLVSPRYFDDAGTRDPADDLDRAALDQTLPKDLEALGNVRIEVVVRNLTVEKDTAVAELFSDAWYTVETKERGAIPRRESDIHRMRLARENGVWKIVSGL